ncbi:MULTISPECIES: YbjN domain-containing protein [unclassified Aureispira]|uniref:YbjN domain-containing protein n=1 Tax=unclassified Aureispira TaxID=2649989 RepID=UPI0006963100|nr:MULTISPECIES: YbjN domain-containing protein [unclassified Aureispira]WMX14759.1 YbjN domain-containing protein [Aureispira sp. CCB-E]
MSYFEKVKELVLTLEYDIVHEEIETGILIINKESRGICEMILDCEDDVLVMEQIIFPVKEDNPEHYKKLLQMNRSLVHGAFVLTSSEDFNIIAFRDTLQLENLDQNELEASLNALTFALVENMDDLLSISGQAEKTV